MIVLPVEKRFDWRNPPVTLFALVLLNVAVFLFYQTGDGQRLQFALLAYQQQGFFEEEWPRYQEYLAATEQDTVLAAVREAHAERGFGAVAHRMLLDEAFAEDLDRVWGWRLDEVVGPDWRTRRARLADAVGSVSSLRFGLTPADLSPPTFVTSLFMHGGLGHLFGNMFFLVMCGFTVEAAIGHLRFLAFYLVAGVLAGVGHALADLDSAVPLIGASGAVSGVMAMYVALFRLRRIEFFYWILVFVGYVRLPALAVLPAWILKELWFFYTQPDASVAFMAHVAGFVAGGVLIGLLMLLRRDLLDETYIEADQDADPRREALAEVYSAIEAYRFEVALRRVETIAETFGDGPTLAILREQLTRACAPERAPEAAVALLSRRDAGTPGLHAQQRVLAAHPELLASVDDEALLRLGTQLCRVDDADNAVRVVDRLVERGVEDPALPALAGMLAQCLGRRQDGVRAQHYARLADRRA